MAVIFDFNGTMFFDEEFQEISWRRFVEQKINRSVSDDEFKKYIHGRNADFTLGYFLHETFTRNEIEVLEEEKESIYRDLCLKSDNFKLAPGLADFLDKLKQSGVLMNIATASGWNNVKFFFENLNLNRWFDIRKVVYNDGSCKGKPEPDMYLKAADNIGVSIKDCFVFEDSVSGIEDARRAEAKGVVKVLSSKENAVKMESDFEIQTYLNINYESFV